MAFKPALQTGTPVVPPELLVENFDFILEVFSHGLEFLFVVIADDLQLALHLLGHRAARLVLGTLLEEVLLDLVLLLLGLG